MPGTGPVPGSERARVLWTPLGALWVGLGVALDPGPGSDRHVETVAAKSLLAPAIPRHSATVAHGGQGTSNPNAWPLAEVDRSVRKKPAQRP